MTDKVICWMTNLKKITELKERNLIKALIITSFAAINSFSLILLDLNTYLPAVVTG